MLTEETINQRLEDMTRQGDPFDSLWPENCAGSRKALVIFVGPSPGGKKEFTRRPINLRQNKPLWDKPYEEPLTWGPGFRASFPPLVETIIGKPSYTDAAKLIARFNMDWLQNPKSQDVSYRYMWEGCLHILPVLYECNPELIIPMDKKTFWVLQIALYNDGHEIVPPKIEKVKVKISDKNGMIRNHENIMAFKAEKDSNSFLVIKSLQHPARIFNAEYAQRIGQTIRTVARQVWDGDAVNIDL
jgi:hypothetical protein